VSDESISKDIKTIAKGGAVQVIGQISQRILSFVFSAIAFRILGSSGYGIYRLVAQVLTNASQLGLAGFNYAAMRFGARARAVDDPGATKGAFRTGILATLVTSSIVFLLVLVAADLIVLPFTEAGPVRREVARYVRIGSPYVVLFALLQVVRYCTQSYKTMVPSVMAGNIVQPAARFVLGVGALLAGAAVTGVVISLNVSIAIALVVAGWYLRRMLTPAERAAEPVSQLRPMARFAIPQMGASLLGVQTLGVAIFILSRYGTPADVGLFAIALQLQGPGNVFLGGVVNIWAPMVSDLHSRGEIQRLGSLYQMLNRWIATFSFPVFAALIISPDVFVRLFGGSEGQGAATAVAILAVGNIFYTGTGPTGYVISMTGHPGVNFFNSVVAVGLYIGLGVWLVPEHGIVGMAIVDVIVTALINSVRVVQAKHLVGIQPFGRTFYKPVVATLTGAAVLLLWRLVPGGLLLEAAGIVLGACVYVLVLLLLGIDDEERYVLDRIKKRALRRKAGRS
jgi:O-antigen/teichoic acid export membrane protein